MPKSRTIGKSSNHNRNSVIQLLITEGPLSRRELAERLGLTKMTIGNIVNYLKENEYVMDVVSDEVKGPTGPKPTVVSILPRKILSIGVHISHSKVTCILLDVIDGVLLENIEYVDKMESNQQLLTLIKEMVASTLNQSREYKSSVVGIGVTYNGIIHKSSGKILYNMNQIESGEINICSILNKCFGLPVILEREMTGAAIAEFIYGDRKEAEDCYYLSISEKICGGRVDHTILSQTNSYMSGEVGHMSIKYDGPLCKCGSRGCYEKYAGINVLLKKSACHSLEELNLKLQDREPLAVREVEVFIQITAAVLINIVNLYDPSKIQIGGEISKLDPSIFQKIERLLNERILYRKERYVKVEISNMKDNANEIGAAVVVLKELFE